MEVKGQAWVKTGSLEEIQACSGYIKTKNKKWIVWESFFPQENQYFNKKHCIPLPKLVTFFWKRCVPRRKTNVFHPQASEKNIS